MRLEERLAQGPLPLVADGAIGTRLLDDRAMPATGPGQVPCVEELNLIAPDLVTAVHRSYRNAGAELAVTNTFSATAGRLAAYGLAERVEQLNRAAVKLARAETAGGWVLGSCGPVRSPETARVEYHQQIAALISGGVDGLLIESVRSVAALEGALVAANEVTGRVGAPLPILVSYCPVDEGLSLTDGSLSDFLDLTKHYSVTAVGANCGDGTHLIFRALAAIRERYDGPLMAMPSAGLPKAIDGRLHYPLTPEVWTGSIRDWHRNLKLTIVGGCCGTTPEHIKRLKNQFYPSDTGG